MKHLLFADTKDIFAVRLPDDVSEAHKLRWI